MAWCECKPDGDICQYCREVMQADFEWWVYKQVDAEEDERMEYDA
jgi:hypothetical protein